MASRHGQKVASRTGDRPDLAAGYLEWLRSREKKTRHAGCAISSLDRYLKKRRRTFTTATVDDLDAYGRWVKRTYRGRREQQARCFQAYQFFGFLVLKHVRDDNPARRCALGLKVWSEREVSKIQDAVDLKKRSGIRDRAIIEMIMCGLMPEQVRILELDDVTSDYCEIITSEFRIVLSGSARKFLRRYVERVRPLAERDSTNRALFITDRQGKRMKKSHLANLHKMIGEVTGLAKRSGMLRKLVR